MTGQIQLLANYIMSEIPGEPSRSEGAGDCAVRLLKQYREGFEKVMAELGVPDENYPANVANAHEIAEHCFWGESSEEQVLREKSELKMKRVFIASFAAHKEPKVKLLVVTTTTSLGAWISYEPKSYVEAVEMAMIHAKERFPESKGYSDPQVAVDELSEEFLKEFLE